MTSKYHPYPEPILTCELVPTSQWGENLRSYLSRHGWDEVRKACYVRADNRCEVCGEQGKHHPVECHEIWEYDSVNLRQTLTGLISLCPPCHEVKHIGLAMTRGEVQFTRALKRLTRLNQWPEELTEQYVNRQFQIHALRSRMNWVIDLSWLDNAAQYVSDSSAIGREKRSQRVLKLISAKR